MKNFLSEKKIHLFFVIGVILKGLNAAIEVAGGIFVLLISHETVLKIVLFLTQDEISEDPHDIVANYLINAARNFSLSTKHFIVIYVLSHGLIKLSVIVGLLRNKLWAYPASIVVFALFIVYQLYRYNFTHSIWLLALSAFDAAVIWLTWHEYKNFKQGRFNQHFTKSSL